MTRTKNDLVWVRLKCGMHVGSVQVARPSRIQGIKNRMKKTVKRLFQF